MITGSDIICSGYVLHVMLHVVILHVVLHVVMLHVVILHVVTLQYRCVFFCLQCFKLWDLDARGFHKVRSYRSSSHCTYRLDLCSLFH